MKPTLLVLAAGRASRYGSLKQLDQYGPSGEAIIDYSIYDAIRAGFGKVVFVVRNETLAAFKEAFAQRYGNKIEIDFAIQELPKLPAGFAVPAVRTKPWGTAHAVWVAADKITTPFTVINADDFYGLQAFENAAKFMSNIQPRQTTAALVGYQLSNTLSMYGTVSRGVCTVDDNSLITNIVERTAIFQNADGIFFKNGDTDEALQGTETVSMNMFCFSANVFEYFEQEFVHFLTNNTDIEGGECYLPSVVNTMVQGNICTLQNIPTTAEWFGVTYQDDKPHVIKKLQELVAAGTYPNDLRK